MATTSFDKKFIIDSQNASSLFQDLQHPQTVAMAQRDYQSDNREGFELLLRLQCKQEN